MRERDHQQREKRIGEPGRGACRDAHRAGCRAERRLAWPTRRPAQPQCPPGPGCRGGKREDRNHLQRAGLVPARVIGDLRRRDQADDSEREQREQRREADQGPLQRPAHRAARDWFATGAQQLPCHREDGRHEKGECQQRDRPARHGVPADAQIGAGLLRQRPLGDIERADQSQRRSSEAFERFDVGAVVGRRGQRDLARRADRHRVDPVGKQRALRSGRGRDREAGHLCRQAVDLRLDSGPRDQRVLGGADQVERRPLGAAGAGDEMGLLELCRTGLRDRQAPPRPSCGPAARRRAPGRPARRRRRRRSRRRSGCGRGR